MKSATFRIQDSVCKSLYRSLVWCRKSPRTDYSISWCTDCWNHQYICPSHEQRGNQTLQLNMSASFFRIIFQCFIFGIVLSAFIGESSCLCNSTLLQSVMVNNSNNISFPKSCTKNPSEDLPFNTEIMRHLPLQNNITFS